MELQFGLTGSLFVDTKDLREVKLEFVGQATEWPAALGNPSQYAPAPTARITLYQNQLEDLLEGMGLTRSFQISGPEVCLTGFPDKGERYRLTLNDITFVLDGKQVQKLGETLYQPLG